MKFECERNEAREADAPGAQFRSGYVEAQAAWLPGRLNGGDFEFQLRAFGQWFWRCGRRRQLPSGLLRGALQWQRRRVRPLDQIAGDGVPIGLHLPLVVHAVPWNRDLHSVRLECDDPEIELAAVRKVIERSLVGVPVLVDLEGQAGSHHSGSQGSVFPARY